MSDNPISNILKRASEPADFAPAHLRANSTDNIRRIAEFVTKLTWREITTIALAVEAEYKQNGKPDLAEAMVVWAEKLLSDGS